ncbi:MAG: hypothetical protein LH650_01440 [Chloroflexi bacterium]|nr:hypothetical protein [Chloroflexota bacterium]
MTTVLSRDPARSRPPTDRPLDIVGLELLVCVTQALLAGLLLSLANELGGDARAVGLPVPGVLAVLGLVVGGTWIWWLVGGSGWPLAAVDFAVALLTGALWLLSLQDAAAPRIDPLIGLLAVSCAVYGIVAGAFLPGPRRGHWKGGPSQPRRGVPDMRTSPARFSAPVQKVVDERLVNMSFNRLAMPAVRLPSVKLPSRVTAAAPVDATGDRDSSPGQQSLSAAAISAQPVPDVDMDAPTMVHRILTSDEPLSVAAMRLAATRPASADVDPDEDETLPFPVVAADADDGDPDDVRVTGVT